MALQFSCTSCGIVLSVGDQYAGQEVQCGGCGRLVVAPMAPTSEAAALNPYTSPGGYAAPPKPTTFFGRKPIQHALLDVGAVFRQSWDMFVDRMGDCLLVSLIFSLIVATIGVGGYLACILTFVGVVTALGETFLPLAFAGTALIILVLMAIWHWIYAGFLSYFLRLCRGERPEFGCLFSGSPVWGRFCTIMFIYVLANLACGVPALLLLLFAFPWLYLVLDRNMTVRAAFDEARRLCEENVASVLLLFLIGIGISLVAAMIPCGVGNLFALPLITILNVNTYLAMSGQADTGKRADTGEILDEGDSPFTVEIVE